MDAKALMLSRTKAFAIRILEVAKVLPHGIATDVLSRQMVRSATPIGANYRSACRARSRADFISKISIAEEESDETMYWLELLEGIGALPEGEFTPLHREADELTAILCASGKTARQRTP